MNELLCGAALIVSNNSWDLFVAMILRLLKVLFDGHFRAYSLHASGLSQIVHWATHDDVYFTYGMKAFSEICKLIWI